MEGINQESDNLACVQAEPVLIERYIDILKMRNMTLEAKIKEIDKIAMDCYEGVYSEEDAEDMIIAIYRSTCEYVRDYFYEHPHESDNDVGNEEGIPCVLATIAFEQDNLDDLFAEYLNLLSQMVIIEKIIHTVYDDIEPSEKITCGCGSIIRNNNIQRHENTKKHQEWAFQWVVCSCGYKMYVDVFDNHCKSEKHKRILQEIVDRIGYEPGSFIWKELPNDEVELIRYR